jgi:hypothetical protein
MAERAQAGLRFQRGWKAGIRGISSCGKGRSLVVGRLDTVTAPKIHPPLKGGIGGQWGREALEMGHPLRAVRNQGS